MKKKGFYIMNFNDYINSQLASGKRMDVLVKEMTDAINAKQKELDKEAQMEAAREKRYNGLVDNITAALDTRAFSFNTAASAVTAYMMDQHPEWSQETVDNFFTEAVDILKGMEMAYKMREDKDPTILALDRLIGELTGVNLSVPHSKQETKEVGLDDRAKVNQFLRQMGL